ncbi:MAG: glycosyltransferase family 4 protein [Phycisphaerales bacterium]|nr:glycosyltransferase family 4 protein [Phycisphaerales bacterium]
MRICHVITRLIIGGAQENTLLTCEGLQAAGHDVTLISGPTDGPEGSLVERARRGGYRFVELQSLVRAVDPMRDAAAFFALKREFRRLTPEIVHTHSSKAGILARFAAAAARVPVVVHTIHGMSFNRTQSAGTRRVYSTLERLAARRTQCVITVADAMIEQTVAAGVCPREKMCTIYSGMEVERFERRLYDRAAVRGAWGFPEDAVVVGSVARLFRNKGYEQLIPIMADAAGREPRLRFVWVGDGAQRGEYEAQLRGLGLLDRVHFVGLVPPGEIPRLMAGFDILAHASQWEGLPRAVVQALLMEVPAVAFAIDGTPEVVLSGKTGFAVPLNDRRAFAEALLVLAGSRENREAFGSAGRKLCLERFDWRRMVNEIEGAYRRLLPG